MSERLKKIEIVIPVYNRREITLQGLRSLSRIDQTNFEVHTIIVDDASPDGTGDAVAREFPEVQIVKGDGTLHYAAGTNRGISAALERKPDFILTANDDSVFHEKFLQRLVKTSDENPRSIIGALLLLWDEPHIVFQVGFQWKTFAGGWWQPENLSAFDFPRTTFEVEGMAGNCVLFPVESIRECGLMDEKKFPHGWGDAQYLMRMKKAGWRLLVEPKALVWCEPNKYPKALNEMSKREILRVLFKDRRYPLNFQRQFIARWESAPSKPKALAAFLIHLLSYSGKIHKIVK